MATITFDPQALSTFLLVLARSSAWVAVAPPFSRREIPTPVKVGISIAVALPVYANVTSTVPALGTTQFMVDLVVQAAIGLLLGFIALVVLSAVQAAGDLLDLFGGFSLAAAFDPTTETNSAMLGRLNQMLTVVLLMAMNYHVLMVRGFITSYQLISPTGAFPTGPLSTTLTTALTTMFVAAVELAAPLIAALFLADVAVGLLSRAAPHMNVLVLALPVKLLMTIVLAGLVVVAIPGVLTTLLEHAIRLMLTAVGAH